MMPFWSSRHHRLLNNSKPVNYCFGRLGIAQDTVIDVIL